MMLFWYQILKCLILTTVEHHKSEQTNPISDKITRFTMMSRYSRILMMFIMHEGWNLFMWRELQWISHESEITCNLIKWNPNIVLEQLSVCYNDNGFQKLKDKQSFAFVKYHFYLISWPEKVVIFTHGRPHIYITCQVTWWDKHVMWHEKPNIIHL